MTKQGPGQQDRAGREDREEQETCYSKWSKTNTLMLMNIANTCLLYSTF